MPSGTASSPGCTKMNQVKETLASRDQKLQHNWLHSISQQKLPIQQVTDEPRKRLKSLPVSCISFIRKVGVQLQMTLVFILLTKTPQCISSDLGKVSIEIDICHNRSGHQKLLCDQVTKKNTSLKSSKKN